MNALSDDGLVHLLVYEPLLGSRYSDGLGEGMTKCGIFFTWKNSPRFSHPADEENQLIPLQQRATCLLCIIEADS